jgi:hypothetical protein
MKAILRFKSGAKVTMDLLNSPLVRLWKDAHLKNLERGNKPAASINAVGLGNHSFEKELTEHSAEMKNEIEMINRGIALANEGIEGQKFPYPAFDHMPWMQANRIHRCYTTASIIKGIWFHNLNTLQLLKCKEEQYFSRSTAFDSSPHTYTVIDRKKFDDGIELINKHIHMYERWLHCQRAIDFHSFYENIIESNEPIPFNINKKSSKYADFNWDNFDEFGGKTGVFSHRTTYEDVKQSIPEDWDKYDLYIEKAIAGKDYEHAYFNYDDPLEADITNLDHIDGGVRLHYDPHVISLYNYKPFVNWYREKGIEDTMVRPVPLGRINRQESSTDLHNILLNGDKPTSLGYPGLKSPFEEPLGIEFLDNNLL